MKQTFLLLALVACTDSLSVPESPTGTLKIGPDKGCRGETCLDVNALAANHVRLLATGSSTQGNLLVASSNTASAVVTETKPNCHDAVCDYIVEVDTKAAGVADITFSTPDGSLVDLTRFFVKHPTTVGISLEATGPLQTDPSRTTIYEGSVILLGAVPFDDQNSVLTAQLDRWSVVSSNPAVIRTDPEDPKSASAVGLGAAELTVTWNGVTGARGVDVVTP